MPTELIALPFALIVVATALWRSPRDATTLLSLFLGALFVLPARFVLGPLGAAGTPAGLVGLACLGWWMVTRLVPNLRLDLERQPVRTAMGLYALAMTAGYLAGFYFPITPAQISGADRALLSVGASAGVALLAADGIQNRQRLDTLLRRLTYGAAFMALTGILQFIHIDIVPYLRLPGLAQNSALPVVDQRSGLERVLGTALHSIEFGVILAAVLPIALHYALTQAEEERSRAMPWIVVTLIGIAIPLSISRSSMVALGVGMLILAWSWTWRLRVLAAASGAIALVVFRSAVPGLLGTILALFTFWGDDPSIAGRTEDYPIIWALVRESPWFGRGLGMFLPQEYFFLDNQFLGTAVDTGIIGLFSLLAVFLIGMAAARGVRRRALDPSSRHLGQALTASLVVLLVSLGTFDGLAFRICAGLIFLTVGVAGALWRLEARSHAISISGDPSRWRLEHSPTGPPFRSREDRLDPTQVLSRT